MDVHLTADGHPVVIHDARVDRTTDGRGAVSKLTASEIADLDAGSRFERRLALRPRIRKRVAQALDLVSEQDPSRQVPGFAGECVPTLEAALNLLSSTAFSHAYIEIKGTRPARSELLVSIVHLIRRFGLEAFVTLLSFDHRVIGLAKEVAPEIRAAINIPAARGAILTSRAVLRSAEEAAADEVALHYGLATHRAVEALHRRGLRVSAWTVNRKVVMRRLIRLGVDAIITDFPDRLRAVIG
jgi:glycerophosphoryl diester phosphodiesterase